MKDDPTINFRLTRTFKPVIDFVVVQLRFFSIHSSQSQRFLNELVYSWDLLIYSLRCELLDHDRCTRHRRAAANSIYDRNSTRAIVTV